jgi:UDP-N-acetylmuramoyl-L-alanyl-D-glutamate--2,6-diaminopimelate ligase
MPRKKLSQLLSPWIDLSDNFDREILHLSLNSQKAEAQGLFFALKGHQTSGETYIEEAIQQGAIAIVKETAQLPYATEQSGVIFIYLPKLTQSLAEIAARFFDYPAKSLSLFGVTGTNGKTTVAYLVAEAFSTLGYQSAYMGTLGVGIYGEALIDTGLTTADAIVIQETLAHFKERGVTHVAIEASSHALSQDRIYGLYFAASVFTNLTHEHLDYHGTMENYFEAKKKLFDKAYSQYAIINADDDYGQRLMKEITIPFMTYSLKEKGGDIYLSDIQYSKTGSDGLLGVTHAHAGVHGPLDSRLRGNDEEIIPSKNVNQTLHTPLLAEFNLYNVLAVGGVLLSQTYPLEKVAVLLSTLHSVPGRMHSIIEKNTPWILIDFAHTPDALEKVLSTIKPLTQGKLWVIFGCGGNRDKEKRPLMGKIAEKFCDHIMLTDDNPRFEDPTHITAEIAEGIEGEYEIMHDRMQAVISVLQRAAAEDTVLIAGKGVEKYQIIENHYLPYDEIKIVERLYYEEKF